MDIIPTFQKSFREKLGQTDISCDDDELLQTVPWVLFVCLYTVLFVAIIIMYIMYRRERNQALQSSMNVTSRGSQYTETGGGGDRNSGTLDKSQIRFVDNFMRRLKDKDRIVRANSPAMKKRRTMNLGASTLEGVGNHTLLTGAGAGNLDDSRMTNPLLGNSYHNLHHGSTSHDMVGDDLVTIDDMAYLDRGVSGAVRKLSTFQ